MYFCPKCREARFETHNDLKLHLNGLSRIGSCFGEPFAEGDIIRCAQPGCDGRIMYTSTHMFRSYLRHLTQIHPNTHQLDDNHLNLTSNLFACSTDLEMCEIDNASISDPNLEDATSDENIHNSMEILNDRISLLILSMRSLTTIPIRIVDHMCKEITEAIQEFTELVFNEIEDRLCPIYMEVDERIKVKLDTEIANMRDSFKQSQCSFKMVDSEYRRKQTLEKMKYLIRPCEVLHREIQIRVAQTDGTILNKPCNALGSHRGAYCIGNWRLTVVNLPVHLCYSNSLLLALAFEEDLAYDYNLQITRRISNELKNLVEAKIRVNFLDGIRELAAYLIGIDGDNKAKNMCTGFTTCFNGGNPCRTCTMVYSDMRVSTDLKPELRRNHDHYKADLVNVLDQITRFGKCKKPVNGIVNDCAFNEHEYFKAFNNVTIDLMHDLFEGILQRDMIRILAYLSERSRYFDRRELNQLIEFYPYSVKDRHSKPVPIPDRYYTGLINCNQSASGMWTLTRYLPIFLRKYSDENSSSYKPLLIVDPVYRLLLELCQLTDLLCSPRVNRDAVFATKLATSIYYEHLKSCFPEVQLTPKHHFLLYWAQSCLAVGPPIRFWSMPHERTHSPMKKLANGINNFWNILKSEAEAHQYHEAINRLQFDLIRPEDFTNDAKPVPVNEIPLYDRLCNTFDMDSNEIVMVVTRLTYLQTDYAKDDIIAIGHDPNDGLVQFAMVYCFVISKNGIIIILARRVQTNYKDHDTLCYDVTIDEDNLEIYTFADLIDYYPTNLLSIAGRSQIRTRWHIHPITLNRFVG
uniref:C2H2-type domain-containing protein n=1 Tax=Acrobeloides nanus TaxID=290746 RepID=A0A914E559_9BILA